MVSFLQTGSIQTFNSVPISLAVREQIRLALPDLEGPASDETGLR